MVAVSMLLLLHLLLVALQVVEHRAVAVNLVLKFALQIKYLLAQVDIISLTVPEMYSYAAHQMIEMILSEVVPVLTEAVLMLLLQAHPAVLLQEVLHQVELYFAIIIFLAVEQDELMSVLIMLKYVAQVFLLVKLVV